VEPGIVLDELNAQLAGSVCASRRYFHGQPATVGGMMANNSSGARSVALRKDDRPRAGTDCPAFPMASLAFS